MFKKTKNYLIIKSVGASIKIVANDAVLLKLIKNNPFLYEYIPNCEIVQSGTIKTNCILVIKKSKIFKVKFSYPLIHCFQSKKTDVKGLISLIGYILERSLSGKGIYSIHSSVISKNGKAVLIFGGTTNLGKTIIAKTAADKFGWLFYSDEVALINSRNNKIAGGVKIAANCDLFKNFNLPNIKNQPKIAAFVHPYIDNGINKIKPWGSAKFFWHLKEELARRIRGGSKAINFFNYPLESLDIFSISKKRLEFAKKLAVSIDCYEMRGTPEFIARAINRLKL